MQDVFHSVHAARIAHALGDVHDAHFRNDNVAVERSNAGEVCSSILVCNRLIEARFYKQNSHSTVQGARKRILMKVDSM